MLRRLPFARRPRLRALFTDPPLPSTFDRLLIANRGEIACRIARTARQLGIETVAVYSDADADAMHVRVCDSAYHIGKSAAAHSYLAGAKIIEVARRSGAQAIHPGYGFLSESAKFANQCEKAGLAFIGPPVTAMESMGSKSASKKIMIAAGVPVVPGYHGDDQSDEKLAEEAERCGFPLLIKAVLGGGGKGMRIVSEASEFAEALGACRREALASFGDDRVLLERYIVRPRHIEFQIFADRYGNAVHLFERDCSAQRRHQKVLEEAPAPGMTDDLRRSMGKAAVDAAHSVAYVGAGTVEFICDADTGDYFFMEMNTRLQVEHPVTEEIVRIANRNGSLDLVQLQLHVAAGHRLPFAQEDVGCAGHCIEARIYAERPTLDDDGQARFLPCVGTVKYLSPPSSPPDGNVKVRVETGFKANDEISVFYDAMIAKLVVWAGDRPAALAQMARSLHDYQILGLHGHNVPFLIRAVRHPDFIAGQITTDFIARNATDLIPSFCPPSSTATAIASLFVCAPPGAISPWRLKNAFRVNMAKVRTVKLESDGEGVEVMIVFNDDGSFEVSFGMESWTNVRFAPDPDHEDGFRCAFRDRTIVAKVVQLEKEITVFVGDEMAAFRLPRVAFGGESSGRGGGVGAIAPMPGKIIKTFVGAGAEVEEGQALIVMEAMKMEHVIRASHSGIVEKVSCKVGEFVDAGAVLVGLRPDPEIPDRG